MRAQLEWLFLEALRAHVVPGDDAVAEMDTLSVARETGTGPAWHLHSEMFAALLAPAGLSDVAT
ncbi:hypothetical protein [Rhodococcus sp. (in: high G+C Gram-positive bacteria)]|uniref:hypothetical protein n=1 Tax=Rhodococcus sp. TaxID=1831 RepID=UPI0038902B9C